MKTWVILVAVLFGAATAFAQPAREKLRVATRPVKPFVLQDGGKLTGFSIELWEEIARQLNVRSDFVVKPTVRELLEAVRSGEADLGIAAISITAEREMRWDFSHPMFDAGLQILVPAQPAGIGFFHNLVSGVFSSAVLPLVAAVAGIILVPAHIVWFFERRAPGGLLIHRSYFPGIFEACWWAAATLATQADQMPKTAAARVAAVIWMFTSVVFIAYFTASVTSSLTLHELRGEIDGPEDLPGKRVATVSGSTSVEYLRQQNAEPLEFTDIEEALDALARERAQAVVYDAPVLLHYAARQGRGRVQVVGPIFRKESYGIAFPPNSPHRKPVNEALLKLKENGVYEQLYRKWFGAAS
ncbi:MAG TPA: transporter substrate-binding domain-containing protein [candidate division Zixibacteria bacterium]|nr:transporter substrate-binding domain-containing protein [candidate division Zixibacteria bacterium]